MLDVATTIFERMIGHSLMEREYNDVLPYKTGGIALKHNPVNTLISVSARMKSWRYAHIFGPTDWLDVTSLASIYNKRGITLPNGMYGEFDEVSVTYTSGLVDMPEDVSGALADIADLLEKREITEWNAVLPDHVLDVIQRHRKEAIERREPIRYNEGVQVGTNRY